MTDNAATGPVPLGANPIEQSIAPAPDMEVVREWEAGRSSDTPHSVATKIARYEIGDRMAAALSAQAVKLSQNSHDAMALYLERAEAAESTVAAQARKIEELEERYGILQRSWIDANNQATAAETTVAELRAELDRVSADAREHYARLTAEVERVTGRLGEITWMADERKRLCHEAIDNMTKTQELLVVQRLRAEAAETQRDTAREALQEAVDVMALNEHTPIRDPQHHERVRALGSEIGFGALMCTAEKAWREALAIQGMEGGEFVAGPCRSTLMKCLAQARASLSPETR